MPRFLALLALAWLTIGTVAHADTYRLPKTGAPAFVVDAPQGWSVSYDAGGNLQMLLADRSGFVQCSMLSNEEAGLPIQEIAARVFKAAGVAPYTGAQPGSIAGLPGQGFVESLTTNGVTLELTVVIVKLDAANAAILSVLRRQGMAPAQSAAMDALIARITFAR